MKTITSIPKTLLLATIILLPPPTTSWARPPQSISGRATVMAVDEKTHSLLLQFAKDQKPIVVDWNQKTEFTRARKPIAPALLRPGETIAIRYRKPFFGNPWLKQVHVEDASFRVQDPG